MTIKAGPATDLAVLNSIAVAVATCDRSGRFVVWNQAAQDRYGWTPEEIVGLPVSFLVEAPHDLDQLVGSIFEGSVASGRWDCRTKGGSTLPSEALLAPWRDEAGAVVGMTVSLGPPISDHDPLTQDSPHPPSTLAVTYHPDGTVIDITDSLCLRLGLRAKDVIGSSVLVFVDPFDAAVVRAELLKAGPSTELGPFLVRLQGAEGAIVPFEGVRIDRTGDPSTRGIVWNLRDLGDLQLVDRSIEESERRYRSIVETAEEGIWIQDRDGIVTFANTKMATMLGTSVSSLVGASFLESIPAPDRTWAAANLDRVADDRFECSLLRADGGTVEVLVSASPVLSGAGEITGVLQMVTDITDRKQIEHQNFQLVMEDPLTGLASRVLVADRIGQILAHQQRVSGLAAVLFMDLDNFKKINDSLGHGAGDQLLGEQARRILSVLRPEDTVGRFGGDEFVVVLDHLDSVEQATLVATRIAEAIAKPMDLDGVEVMTTVSIGVATTPSLDAESIMRDADTAMYRAKDRGGNCYQLFDHTLRARALDRIDLERDLRRAIEANEFRVHYQPVITLDGGIVGFEALARWHHPTRGLVPPGDFIPVAESTGVIVDLGLWILNQACADLAHWRSYPGSEQLTVAVNLSGRQLLEPGLPAHIHETLAVHHLEGGALWLEITESVLMDDAHAANSALAAIHNLGVNLAVDDFGTGYSSLLYLRRFPVDALKLDRFFVAGLDKTDEDRVIVRAVIELAHSLNLVAIAEGIESEIQRRMLADMGCDLAQGFLWSPGVPADKADAMVRVMRVEPQQAADDAPNRGNVATGWSDQSGDGQRTDQISVLLVDDSDGDRSLLRDQLEASGSYQVVGEATDGQTAVTQARQLRPEVLLLDMAMPGMNGLETLPQLLEASPSTRVVVLSGYLSTGLREQAMATGAVAIFEKGMGFDSIVEQLARFDGDQAR